MPPMSKRLIVELVSFYKDDMIEFRRNKRKVKEMEDTKISAEDWI